MDSSTLEEIPMNGSWLAMLQVLGFDIMLAAIVVLFVLNAVEPILQRWRVRLRERRPVARGVNTPLQPAIELATTSAEVVAASGRRSRRPKWLVGAFGVLPTRHDTASPGAHSEDSTTPPGRRAA